MKFVILINSVHFMNVYLLQNRKYTIMIFKETLHTSSDLLQLPQNLKQDFQLIFTQKDIPLGSTIQGNRGISDQQEIGNRRIHRAFQTNPINPQALDASKEEFRKIGTNCVMPDQNFHHCMLVD